MSQLPFTPVLVPQANRRVAMLPPLRRSHTVAPAGNPEDGVTIVQMVRRLNVSQWLVVLYPLFLFLVHRRRDEGDAAVVDSSALCRSA